MKYYLDTEFIEGFHKPLFGKKRHFIDLISIGIVAEDGRELYLISNEYNYNDADDWVKENVIMPLYLETVHGDMRNNCTASDFHKIYGKANKEIGKLIIDFVYPIDQMANYYYVSTGDFPDVVDNEKLRISDKKGRLIFSIFDKELKPELNAFKPYFYAYYADYDWVLFCSLFGRMIDLPKGFPMYCIDLKQMIDQKAREVYPNDTKYHKADKWDTLEDRINWVKAMDDYPKQENEHSALDDARWNKKLHQFLDSI